MGCSGMEVEYDDVPDSLWQPENMTLHEFVEPMGHQLGLHASVGSSYLPPSCLTLLLYSSQMNSLRGTGSD